MQNRVERLRVWLLGSAIFLTLVIAAFIGYARFLSRFRHLKMPANLGVNIVRETDGFTYSQSVQGKTVYTIHASKAVEHTDGKIALHHVFILLYGRSGSRSDRIYGDEFEYDVKAGVVRALGLVHIDLQASEPATGQANKPVGPGDADAAPNPKMLHVTTRGLVYMEKLGVAGGGSGQCDDPDECGREWRDDRVAAGGYPVERRRSSSVGDAVGRCAVFVRSA